MRNNKGITLVALVMTIVILLILASIATYSGVSVIKSSRWTAFIAELNTMQAQVNTIYEENKENLDIGVELTGSVKERADVVFSYLGKSQEGYRYWDKKCIKDLKIEGVEQDFFVNLSERSIISYQGFEYEGKTYYMLSQLENGLYNVDYKNPNLGKPTFSISQEKIGESKWKISISNILYQEGYINKWKVQYQLQGKDFWNTSDDLEFIIDTPGRYDVILTNGEVQSDPQIISIGSWWDETKKWNVPSLSKGMQAVYFEETGEEKVLTSENTKEEWDKWYEYVAGDNDTDSKDSKWANAKTNDGSYFVWIPRYEYKILSGEGTTQAGKIEVKFIPTNQTTPDEGYKIHPAFIDGTKNHFKNGEWDKELAGIWVAKYEISMETNGVATTTSNESVGNVVTNDTIKMVSKPNVSSWRYINAGNSYTNCYEYDKEKESHLMKNSEWGAVAYLTHSQYGRNSNEIAINNSSSYITKTGGNMASSTGNEYGIYDLSGGTYELTATYLANGNINLETYGASFTKTVADPEAYLTKSTKYVTIYPHDVSNDEDINNYLTYQNAGYGHGDAILETSTGGEIGSTTSWFADSSVFLAYTTSFCYRGGYYDSGATAGIFNFNRSDGNSDGRFGFRLVFIE